MKEATKTNRIRPADFSKLYLSGRVLDIGASTDPVSPNAEIFDLDQGDANHILNYLDEQSYDTVHSSHCLEHMYNPEKSILDWWQLVRPGGYFICVVPEENLYEQGLWPSWFNSDHKSTFRINGTYSWSPVSYDILRLAEGLPNGLVVSCLIQQNGYDLHYRRTYGELVNRIRWVDNIAWHLSCFPKVGNQLSYLFMKICWPLGIVIDQTKFGALAQIEVIVRKK